MDKPVLGTVVRATDAGIRSTNQVCWLACEGCGHERWVILRGGRPRSRWCRTCGGRRTGQLPHCSVQARCDFCYRGFEKTRTNQRFCSDDCKDRFWVSVTSAARAAVRAEQPTTLEKRAVYELVRRARKRGAGGSFTAEEWHALCALYGYRCLSCKAVGVRLTADHVIPVSLGGTSDISNIQPLCGPCNSRKGVLVIDFRGEVS